MRPWPMAMLFILAALVAAAACNRKSDETGGRDLSILAESAPEYRRARRGRALAFPADHGAHPEYRFEWWYLTANLEDGEGRMFGAQWTLFRIATAPPGAEHHGNPWHDPQVFMAHMAITTPQDHLAFQRYARGGEHGGLARAGVKTTPFAAWLDDWAMRSTGPGFLPLEVTARQDFYAIRLHLDSNRRLVLQGDGGFSQRHVNGTGSHYYSHPYLRASGELELAGERIALRGQAWLDREWGSRFLEDDQVGWDWFALHLDSGEKFMLYRLRARPGAEHGDFLHSVLLSAHGEKRILDPTRIELAVRNWQTVAGRKLPLAWVIDLPEVGRRLEVEALHPEQWMDLDFPYWEGVVTVLGDGSGNRGRGYLELSGYTGDH